MEEVRPCGNIQPGSYYPLLWLKHLKDPLVMGCRFVSMHMNIMADFSNWICHAVSLCRMVGKLPFGHDRAHFKEKLVPYQRAMTTLKAPLQTVRANSSKERETSQHEVHFLVQNSLHVEVNGKCSVALSIVVDVLHCMILPVGIPLMLIWASR